jgi:hypothetical protein
MPVGRCTVCGGLNAVKSLDVYYGPEPWPIAGIANTKLTYKNRGHEKNNLLKKYAGMLARNI